MTNPTTVKIDYHLTAVRAKHYSRRRGKITAEAQRKRKYRMRLLCGSAYIGRMFATCFKLKMVTRKYVPPTVRWWELENVFGR